MSSAMRVYQWSKASVVCNRAKACFIWADSGIGCGTLVCISTRRLNFMTPVIIGGASKIRSLVNVILTWKRSWRNAMLTWRRSLRHLFQTSPPFFAQVCFRNKAIVLSFAASVPCNWHDPQRLHEWNVDVNAGSIWRIKADDPQNRRSSWNVISWGVRVTSDYFSLKGMSSTNLLRYKLA